MLEEFNYWVFHSPKFCQYLFIFGHLGIGFILTLAGGMLYFNDNVASGMRITAVFMLVVGVLQLFEGVKQWRIYSRSPSTNTLAILLEPYMGRWIPDKLVEDDVSTIKEVNDDSRTE